MLCELPPHAAGAVVVATEESPAELTATALYVPEVVVEGLSTASGGTAGGTVVKISAEWLPDGDVLAARVGTTGPVAARWMSRLSAEAVTPARTAGAAEMWLDVFGDSRSSTSAWFSYAEPGAVVAAMPSLAPVSGTEGRRSWDGVCPRATWFAWWAERGPRDARCRREVWDTPSCLWMAILERRW